MCVVGIFGEEPPESVLRIPAILRYQTRLTSSSVTATVIMFKRSDERQGVRLPDNEDVGVFVGAIACLLWETVDVELRKGHRERNCSKFLPGLV